MAAIFLGAAVVLYVKFHDKFDGNEYDPRGFKKSKTGTYGTATWMSEKELKEIMEVTTPAKAEGVILGEYDGKTVCMPKDTRLNRHIAIFGASGTMKSRAVIRNALFQALRRGESVVITDPKAELYHDTSEMYRNAGYCPGLQHPEIKQAGLHKAPDGTKDGQCFDYGLPAADKPHGMFPDWLWWRGGEGSAPVRKEGREKDNAKKEKSVPFGTAACRF